MKQPARFKTVLALGALLVGAACNTPRDAAESDSLAGGSPAAKLDSTNNPATIEGKPADTTRQPGTTDSARRRPPGG